MLKHAEQLRQRLPDLIRGWLVVVGMRRLSMSMNHGDTDGIAQEVMSQPTNRNGRYRFRSGQPLDPDAGVHPEMVGDDAEVSVNSDIPNSPEQLIAMQDNKQVRPEKPDRSQSAKVKQVLELMEQLETSAHDDQQIALEIVRHLERFHDEVVEEMQDDTDAKHSQIAAWAVDADRLMHCRIVLESIDLE